MIYAYWWKRFRNFGDVLNPWILRVLSGQRVQWSNSPHKPVLIAVGSVVQSAHPGWTVWGSGCISGQAPIPRGLSLCAVRGPRTLERLVQNGYPRNVPLGDPALLLPILSPPRRCASFDWGILPHFIDYPALRWILFSQIVRLLLARGLPSRQRVLLINPLSEPQLVLRQIQCCAKIASSSLHGLIVADAYGIPNVWFTVHANLLKTICLRHTTFQHDPFKYHDYFASVQRDTVAPIPVAAPLPWEAFEEEVKRWSPVRWQPTPLLATFPVKSKTWDVLIQQANAYYARK